MGDITTKEMGFLLSLTISSIVYKSILSEKPNRMMAHQPILNPAIVTAWSQTCAASIFESSQTVWIHVTSWKVWKLHPALTTAHLSYLPHTLTVSLNYVSQRSMSCGNKGPQWSNLTQPSRNHLEHSIIRCNAPPPTQRRQIHSLR